MKPTMFWYQFFPKVNKTRSVTILSLSDIGRNGNTDKNLFVRENTVIWGHPRLDRVKQGSFRSKRLKMMKKGWKVLKRDEIFIKYFEFPLKFWWRHHLFEVHFEVLLTVFGEFTVLRRGDESSEFLKSGFRLELTLFDTFQYFPSLFYRVKYMPWKFRECNRVQS